MLLYEGLTWVHSQNMPRLHFGEGSALMFESVPQVTLSLAC